MFHTEGCDGLPAQMPFGISRLHMQHKAHQKKKQPNKVGRKDRACPSCMICNYNPIFYRSVHPSQLDSTSRIIYFLFLQSSLDSTAI